VTIWKCPIPIEDHFTLELPHNARILTVQIQFEQAYIWVLVDPTIPRVQHHFRLVKTGEDFSEPAEYLGTFQHWIFAAGGRPDLHTWHLFRTVS
jgi:hypothetical protein